MREAEESEMTAKMGTSVGLMLNRCKGKVVVKCANAFRDLQIQIGFSLT